MNTPDEVGCKLSIVVFHRDIVSFSGYYQLILYKQNTIITKQNEEKGSYRQLSQAWATRRYCLDLGALMTIC
jgi:hypothetical protein